MAINIKKFKIQYDNIFKSENKLLIDTTINNLIHTDEAYTIFAIYSNYLDNYQRLMLIKKFSTDDFYLLKSIACTKLTIDEIIFIVNEVIPKYKKFRGLKNSKEKFYNIILKHNANLPEDLYNVIMSKIIMYKLQKGN